MLDRTFSVSEPNRPSEFRRYRQALSWLYLAVVTAGALLLIASVVHALFLQEPVVQLKGDVLSAENPDPASLLRCNEDVAAQLDDLVAEASGVVRGERTLAHWEQFSRRWLTDWNELNARCRFSELSDSALGLAYDRMASVHKELPALRLKYQSLLVRFDEEQSEELAAMRNALRLSARALEKRASDVPSEGLNENERRDDDRYP